MNTEAIVSLAATLVKLSLGVMVFLSNPKNPLNRMWLAFVASLVVLGFADFGVRLHSDPSAAESFFNLGIIGFGLFPGFFLHFSLVYTGRWVGTLRIPALLVLHGLGLGFVLLQFLGYVVGLVPHQSAHAIVRGPGYEYFFGWMVVCFGIGLTFCLIRSLRTRSKQERTQSLLILLGLATIVAAGIIPDSVIVPDWLGSFHVAAGASAAGVILVSIILGRLHSVVPTPDVVAGRVLDSMGDLVCVVNREGYLTFATELFRTTLGIPPDRPLGAVHVKDIVVEYERIYELFDHAEEPGPAVIEVHYRSPESTIPVSVSVSRMREKKPPSGLVLIARDISERQELTRMVEESKEKYRDLVESSLDGIVVVQDGSMVFVNESAVRIFGYSTPEEMLAVRFEDTVAPGSKPFLTRELLTGAPGEDIFRNYEMKGLTKAGSTLDLEINARHITWNGESAIQASFRDITERKGFERDQALWFWEQESLLAIDRQLVSMVDLAKILHAVTRHARAFTRADFSGIIMVNEEKQTYHWRGVLGNQHAIPSGPLPLKNIHRTLLREKSPVIFRPDNSENFPALSGEDLLTVAGFPFRIKLNLEGVLAVGFRKERRFTDREVRLLSSLAEKSAIAIANAGLYEDLREREKDLENLTNSRAAAQEDERKRIAREIHDGLGQMLTAIKFNVEVLEDTLGLREDERKKLEDIKRLLANVMTEAREISYNLMPSILMDFGLSPALQNFCDTFSDRMKIKTAYRSHGVHGRFDQRLEVNLYRIAQEALNNIAKHAEAAVVDVQLLRNEQGIRMSVEDDGKGFLPVDPPRPAGSSGGMGIVSMRERALAFGGILTIESSPGKGTTVLVEIPESRIESHGND